MIKDKFCTACGSEVELNSKFCAQCGEKISSQIAPLNDGFDNSVDIEKTNDTLFSQEEISSFSEINELPSVSNAEIPTKIHAPSVNEISQNLFASTVISQQSLEQKNRKKGLIIGVVLGLLVLIGTVIWIPYSEKQRTYKLAQAEEARIEKQAAEKLEQERIALEKEKQAEVISAFEEAKASKRITSLGEFVKKYPDSSYVKEAEDLAYQSLKRQNSAGALAAFQKWFPTHGASELPSYSEDDLKTDEQIAETTNWNGPFDSFGKPHGKGYANFPSGSTFRGELRHGERVYGTETEPDGTVYTGPFKGLHRHGNGILTFDNGVRYEGDFVLGFQQGKGVLTSPDGYRYDGEFLKGTITGYGVEKLVDGSVYEGRLVDGEFDGKGSLDTNQGVRYDGMFSEGDFHGKGKLFIDGKMVYDGDWVKGDSTGWGVYNYSDGGRYEGNFIDGNRSGNGTQIDSEGNKYIGEFLNDEYHGSGTIYFTDGTQELAVFENGERVN